MDTYTKACFSACIAALVANAGLVAGLGACSNNDGSVISIGKFEDTIKVVTSTRAWTGIADTVIDDEKTSIDLIIASNNIDPHSYEPATADIAKVEDADILITGGGRYNAWLTSSLHDAKDETIISTLPQEESHEYNHDHEGHDNHEDHDDREGHEHDHNRKGHNGHEGHEGHEHHHHDGEANGHTWYDTDAVEETAEQLADTLIKLGAKVDAKAVDKETRDTEEAKSRLKAATVAWVRPPADDTLKDTKVGGVTPKGYCQFTPNESEPPASDANETLKLVKSGEPDYLIDAPQIHGQVS